MALTGKQKIFIDEYLKCFNATEAALNAGYSERCARQIGSENLAKPAIKIELDKVLEQYKKIELKDIAKKPTNRKSYYVYLIGADNGLIKIGVTSNVERRFIAIDGMSPVPLHIVHYFYHEKALKIEKKLHEMFAVKRVRGEWFNLSQDDISYIISKYSD